MFAHVLNFCYSRVHISAAVSASKQIQHPGFCDCKSSVIQTTDVIGISEAVCFLNHFSPDLIMMFCTKCNNM